MVGEPPTREEEQVRLTGARNEFVASLPRRLEVLRAALHQIAIAPGDLERLNGLIRRLHALASAATVLGFASVAEALSEAERALRRAGRSPGQGAAFQGVARALDVLPALVLGAPFPVRMTEPEPDAAPEARPFPLSVLMFGGDAFADVLTAHAPERIEVDRTEDPERARDLARTRGPDAAVIDGDLKGARELIESLRADPSIDPFPILVIGHFANAEGATGFVALGADRVLPKPVSPEMLTRTLIELGGLGLRVGGGREPLGELTVEALADRIAREVRKGLVESLEASGRSTRIEFGNGADVMGAVWGAVARVRELVTLRSEGNLRFEQTGPAGAIPFASWTSDQRRAGERGGRSLRSTEDVALKGRRVVVADDDPAVVWFLSGLLRAVGAEVIEAHDGNRALECVFEVWPDLVVSDVLMPGRDGFSLCHEIKRDVAVRDVPVILLSWKEDLLQRVRELGADADGYLRKEMAAGTVVERLREVLRPRARVEQRLRSGGEVRGRLDGITPRLVLELVTRFCPDSTLTFRDAVYLYEARVRGGRLRSITRSAADGSSERGEPVLSAMLGVSAGRFAVLADSSPTPSEFDAPLRDLLEGPVRRARAALAATAAERLQRVLRVDVDLVAMRRYLDCTPENARRLVERLAQGESPRALLSGGLVSPWLLEAVLSDLGRRGAIRAVESEASSAAELVSEELLPEARPKTLERFSVATSQSAWSEEPHPGNAVQSNTRVSADVVSDGPAQPEPSGSETSGPLVSAARGANGDVPSHGLHPEAVSTSTKYRGDAWFTPPLEASTAAREIPPVEPSVLDEESSSVAMAITEESDPFADFGLSEPPRSEGRTPAGLGPLSRTLASDEGQRVATPIPRPGIRPALKITDPLEGASPNMVDVFTAALAEGPLSGLRSPGDSMRSPSHSPPEISAPPGVPGPSEPPPRTLVSPYSKGSEAQAAKPDEAPAGQEQAAQERVEQERAAKEEAQTRVEDERVSQERAVAEEGAQEHTHERAADERVSAEELATRRAAEARAAEERAAEERAAEERAARQVAQARAEEVRRSEERAAAEERARSVENRAAEARAAAAAKAGQRGSKTARLAAEKGSDASPGESPLRTALLGLGAFGAAFVVVRWVVVPALAPPEIHDPAALSSTLAAPLTAPAAKKEFPMEVRIEPLPQGTDPGVGKGLIDFSSAPDDALYVDGTFVGRGPRRLVPVPIGRHELRILRGDTSRNLTVEVTAEKSTRVDATPGAEAPPAP